MARLHVHEVLVKDTETAAAPPRTVRVDDVDDVVRAADVAKVFTDALAQVHPSIARPLDQHQLVCRVAFGAKIL